MLRRWPDAVVACGTVGLSYGLRRARLFRDVCTPAGIPAARPLRRAGRNGPFRGHRVRGPHESPARRTAPPADPANAVHGQEQDGPRAPPEEAVRQNVLRRCKSPVWADPALQ